jgi:hypothetical protein
MRLSATEILRRHCQERRLRRAVRALDMEREPSAVPLLSHDAWVDSLGLVALVPEHTLAMLEEFYMGEGTTEWTTVLVEVQGQEAELRKEQVAVPLRLADAACLATGMLLDHKAARALQLEAIGLVTDALVRRASREEAR